MFWVMLAPITTFPRFAEEGESQARPGLFPRPRAGEGKRHLKMAFPREQPPLALSPALPQAGEGEKPQGASRAYRPRRIFAPQKTAPLRREYNIRERLPLAHAQNFTSRLPNGGHL
jgi:hypothetical protein